RSAIGTRAALRDPRAPAGSRRGARADTAGNRGEAAGDRGVPEPDADHRRLHAQVRKRPRAVRGGRSVAAAPLLVPRREHREAVRPGQHHLESLDAFRGLTIAGMILVNNPGNWDTVYAPLVHAEWNGCTLADLVYPFFLVILGVALPFALARRRESGHEMHRVHARIVRRSVLLFALGFVLNLVAAQFSFA